jgi:hypothetical protein
MNTFKIILILLILLVACIFEYSLLVDDVWPRDVFKKLYINIESPFSKKCAVSGNLRDTNGNLLQSNTIPCNQCANYMYKTPNGCIPMQFDGDECKPFGAMRSC